MRNLLIIVTGVVVLNAVMLYSGGFDYIKDRFGGSDTETVVRVDVQEVFKETLEKEVQGKIGMPVEGYEPSMFMQVFPGLTETDFDAVEASLGIYSIEGGRLVFILDETQLVHSAAKAITRDGMKTLLRNVSSRIDVDLANGGTITDIISAITQQ